MMWVKKNVRRAQNCPHVRDFHVYVNYFFVEPVFADQVAVNRNLARKQLSHMASSRGALSPQRIAELRTQRERWPALLGNVVRALGMREAVAFPFIRPFVGGISQQAMMRLC
ncbi:uncharacterized protein MEPE_00123 [Melanopsichium pennsylvanicum]|uniref:Uncharacterized protein n=1 Tax=Melanopsichium pennsylvanicum TaxID=63383 RepID=A0AAJ5C2C5_9BASI|nr:uncharacterized protein MEPE_00123 [Melanopsichium pennsylvanicum]